MGDVKLIKFLVLNENIYVSPYFGASKPEVNFRSNVLLNMQTPFQKLCPEKMQMGTIVHLTFRERPLI